MTKLTKSAPSSKKLPYNFPMPASETTPEPAPISTPSSRLPTISIKSPLPSIKQFVKSSFKSDSSVSTSPTSEAPNPLTKKRRRDSIRDVLRGKYGITATEVVPVYVPPRDDPKEGPKLGGNWQLRWGPMERRPSEAVYDGFEYYKSKSISGPARKKTYLNIGN